jgi:hypothetical protein
MSSPTRKTYELDFEPVIPKEDLMSMLVKRMMDR